MRKFVTRRQFIKTSAIGATALGMATTAGYMITDAPVSDIPSPYSVLPEIQPLDSVIVRETLFLDDHQYRMVYHIASLIVPSDDTPGAAEAGVADYIDERAAGSKKIQKRYADGLKWIEQLSYEQFGKDFLQLGIKAQIDLLMFIDEAEQRYLRPVSTIPERVGKKIELLINTLFRISGSTLFFTAMRKDVLSGYYSSPVSWEAVGYFGPPQPLGYPDYAEGPSDANYIDTIRPINSDTCQNCHFDQVEKVDHLEQNECMDCHDLHTPLKEYVRNG